MSPPCHSRHTGALALALFIASCSSPETELSAIPPLLVRMAQESGHDHPTAHATRELPKLAESSSEGRIRLRVYEDGYLGDDTEVVEQLRFGGIDIAVVSLRALDGTARSATLLGKGGSFSSMAAMEQAIDGTIGAHLAEELESSRLLLLSWYDGGPECYLLPRTDGLPSLTGLRIGVERSKAVIDELTAAGAIPVPLSTLEFRRALEAGLVDGVRAPLAFALSSRLDADYRVVPIPDSRLPMLVIGSRVSLMKMPGYDRDALSESLRASKVFQSDAMAFMEARFARDNPRLWALPLNTSP